MKTAQADLTTGPLGKQIFRFSIPLIFSNLLQVLFNMADVAVVALDAIYSEYLSDRNETNLEAEKAS